MRRSSYTASDGNIFEQRDARRNSSTSRERGLSVPMSLSSAFTLNPSASGEGGGGTRVVGGKVRNGQDLIVLAACLVVVVLFIPPVWNSAALLRSANYVFWAGATMAASMLGLFVLFGILSVVTILAFVRLTHKTSRNELTVSLLFLVFGSLFGVMCILFSLPINKQANDTYHNLMFKCEFSPQTLHVHDYWRELAMKRNFANCTHEHSIENCGGFNPTPMSEFLKATEDSYRCSGFCFQPPVTEEVAAAIVSYAAGEDSPVLAIPVDEAKEGDVDAAGTDQEPTSLLSISMDHRRKGHHNHRRRAHLTRRHPPHHPTKAPHRPSPNQAASHQHHRVLFAAAKDRERSLFSKADYPARCGPMLARDMRDFVGGIATQTFSIGVAMIFIGTLAGFVKLTTLCHSPLI